MRRWLIRIGVLLALVAIVFALRATVLKPKPLEVRAVEAARGTVEETVTNTRAGTVKARRRAQISPEVGGRAVDIPHREGDRVAKGDILCGSIPRSSTRSSPSPGASSRPPRRNARRRAPGPSAPAASSPA